MNKLIITILAITSNFGLSIQQKEQAQALQGKFKNDLITDFLTVQNLNTKTIKIQRFRDLNQKLIFF